MAEQFAILIVDDEEIVLDLYSDILKRTYQNVFTAQNGLDALNILKKEKIHLIISDMRMPFMDGNRLTRAVRLSYPDIKIILTTGKVLEENERDDMLKLGVSCFLYKPTKPDELLKYAKDIEEKCNFYDSL